MVVLVLTHMRLFYFRYFSFLALYYFFFSRKLSNTTWLSLVIFPTSLHNLNSLKLSLKVLIFSISFTLLSYDSCAFLIALSLVIYVASIACNKFLISSSFFFLMLRRIRSYTLLDNYYFFFLTISCINFNTKSTCDT